MHTQTILLPSKAEVTPPPVHARNMQRVRRRVREEDWERDTVSVQNVTCLPVHAKIIWCQSQAQKHIKRNGIQAAPSPSEWDTGARYRAFIRIKRAYVSTATHQVMLSQV